MVVEPTTKQLAAPAPGAQFGTFTPALSGTGPSLHRVNGASRTQKRFWPQQSLSSLAPPSLLVEQVPLQPQVSFFFQAHLLLSCAGGPARWPQRGLFHTQKSQHSVPFPTYRAKTIHHVTFCFFLTQPWTTLIVFGFPWCILWATAWGWSNWDHPRSWHSCGFVPTERSTKLVWIILLELFPKAMLLEVSVTRAPLCSATHLCTCTQIPTDPCMHMCTCTHMNMHVSR